MEVSDDCMEVDSSSSEGFVEDEDLPLDELLRGVAHALLSGDVEGDKQDDAEELFSSSSDEDADLEAPSAELPRGVPPSAWSRLCGAARRGAPLLFCKIVVLQLMLGLCLPRDLHCVEIFSGLESVTSSFCVRNKKSYGMEYMKHKVPACMCSQ